MLQGRQLSWAHTYNNFTEQWWISVFVIINCSISELSFWGDSHPLSLFDTLDDWLHYSHCLSCDISFIFSPRLASRKILSGFTQLPLDTFFIFSIYSLHTVISNTLNTPSLISLPHIPIHYNIDFKGYPACFAYSYSLSFIACTLNMQHVLQLRKGLQRYGTRTQSYIGNRY